tara:strand:- start:630 stop:1034 length:405 start_codon:yes stop_codon:yes gene_type:complete
MSFASKMQGVANKLLSKFDERTGDDRLAILKQGSVVWNDTKAENEFGPDVKYFLTGTQVNIDAGLVDGSTIKQGDMMLTVSTVIVDSSGTVVDYTPRTADKILIDGVEWSIVNTPHSNYTGNALTVVYKMQVRK